MEEARAAFMKGRTKRKKSKAVGVKKSTERPLVDKGEKDKQDEQGCTDDKE
jgi:hypothetical protein